MLKLSPKNNSGYLKFIDLGFLLVILLSFFQPNLNWIYKAHTWILLVGIWGVFSTVFYNFKIGVIEILFSILAAFLILHFCFYTPEIINKHFRFTSLFAYPIFFINTIRLLKTHKNSMKTIVVLIISLTIIQASIGILQYAEIVSYRSDFFKVIGSFTSPNFLASFLSFGIVAILWYLLYEKPKHNVLKIALYSAFIFLIYSIYLTASRTGILMSSIGTLVLLLSYEKFITKIKSFSKPKKIVVFISSGILSIIAILGLYNLKLESSNGRIFTAKITLQEIVKKPFLGHGFFSFSNGYNKAKSDYFLEKERNWEEIKLASHISSTYNDYLYIIYEYGIIWSILALFFVIYFIYTNYKKTHKNNILGLSFVLIFLIGILFLSLSDKTTFLSLAFLGLAFILIENKEYKSNTKINRLLIGSVSIFILISTGSEINSRKKIDTLSISSNLNLSNKELTDIGVLFSKVYDYGRLNFKYGLLINEIENKGFLELKKGFEKSRIPKYGKIYAEKLIKNGNYKEAEEVLKFNVGNEPFRYEPRVQLLKFYKKNYDKVNVLKEAKKIDKLPVKIASKKVNEYKEYASIFLNLATEKTFDIEGNLTNDVALFSKHLDRKVNYSLYLPKVKYITKKTPVLYLVDGQHYINNASFIKKIDLLIKQEKIAPVILVFVDPRDVYNKEVNYRNEYFWCNKNYVHFFTQELLPEIERQYPVSNERENRGIMGHSFGGLFSNYLGYEAHYLFKNVIMQSPAFYKCPDIYDLYRNSKNLDLKMYMSYGTGNDTEAQDLPMISVLQNKEYDLKVNVEEGGNHDWNTWMDQTEEIMIYFYGKKN